MLQKYNKNMISVNKKNTKIIVNYCEESLKLTYDSWLSNCLHLTWLHYQVGLILHTFFLTDEC